MPKIIVLFIGFTWPEPSTTAAGHRMLQLLRFFFDKKYRTVFASAATETTWSDTMDDSGIEKVPIKLNDSSFDEFVTKLRPDIVVFDRFLTEEQFGWRVAESAPKALRILDTEDLHSLRKIRETHFKRNQKTSVKQGSNGDSKLRASQTIASWLQSDTTKREIASIYRCDLSLIISSYEMELLTDVLKIDRRLLVYLPFMLDSLKSCDIKKWPAFEARKDFVCLGNGRHAPNVDAVVWLKEKIWPLIHKQLPEAHLHIYGAYLPERIRRMSHPKKHFHVLGWTENAMEVLQHARLNLAPLRFGAGIKGKLVDAMRTGTPSITTSIGAEGMHADLPWAGAIGDSAEEFTEAAIRLYRHPVEWRQAQQNGVTIINLLYRRDELSQKLSDAMGRIQNNLSEHRQNNFIGAMLMHHTLASTKYLAKWIASKNNRM